MDVVEKKEADIEKALNHKFSDEEVNWVRPSLVASVMLPLIM